jgi:hypothetical protein
VRKRKKMWLSFALSSMCIHLVLLAREGFSGTKFKASRFVRDNLTAKMSLFFKFFNSVHFPFFYQNGLPFQQKLWLTEVQCSSIAGWQMRSRGCGVASYT